MNHSSSQCEMILILDRQASKRKKIFSLLLFCCQTFTFLQTEMKMGEKKTCTLELSHKLLLVFLVLTA